MKELIKKLTSRKFLAAVAGVIAGLCMVFGLDENEISTVAGAVVALCSAVSYVITEGRVDAQSVKRTVEEIQQAETAISKSK